MRLTFLVALAIASLASTCPRAHADARPGPLHLSLEGGLFAFSRESAEVPGEDDDVKQIAVGYPLELGARIGYRALEFLEVGATFSFNYLSSEDERLGASNFAVGAHRIAAYARYLAPGERFRFFAGPKIGGEFAKQGSTDDDDLGESSIKGRALTVGFDLGLYGFVTDSLSIDPVFGFAYQTGSVTLDNAFVESDIDVSGIQLTLGIALSGWI